MMPATKTEVTVTISEKRSKPNNLKEFIPPKKSVKKTKKSANYGYIEIIKVIKINEMIADTKWIS